MLENIKAVIFDLDGTLIDSMGVWYEIDVEYLGGYGFSVPSDLQRMIEGMSFTEVAVYFKERFHIPEPIEEIKKIWKDMAMDKYCNHVSLKPGAADFIKYLHANGIKMAVASSNDRKLIEAVLDNHGLLPYFSCVITACDVNKGKPAPDVYLKAASLLNVEPGECLVFEDIVPGIMSGKNAGMIVCAVEDTYSIPQKEEKRASADYYIEDYFQVTAGTYEEL